MPKALPLLQKVTRMHQNGLIKQLPVWVSAMQIIPPTTPLPKAVCQTNVYGTTGFEPKMDESMVNHYEREIKSLYPTPKTLRSNQIKHTRTARKLRPQEIVYPEDRLRQRFYRDHPYELIRVQTLTEDGNEVKSIDYSTPLSERNHVITGEDVIQHQLYLISKGLTINDSYEQVVREFHQVRLREEEKARLKADQDKNNRLWEVMRPGSSSLSFKVSEEYKAKYPQNYAAWLQEEDASYKCEKAAKLRLQTIRANREQKFP